MKVTDYDLNYDLSSIATMLVWIEGQKIEIEVADFLEWLVDRNNWFLDASQLLVSIPDSELIWSDDLGAYIVTTSNVFTYSWEKLQKTHKARLQNWMEEYVNEKYDEAEILDFDDQEEIDSAIEYRRKFA